MRGKPPRKTMNEEEIAEKTAEVRKAYRTVSALELARADGYEISGTYAVVGHACADARNVLGLHTDSLTTPTMDYTASIVALLDDGRKFSPNTVAGLKAAHSAAELKDMAAEVLGIEKVTNLSGSVYRFLAMAELSTGKDIPTLVKEHSVRDESSFYEELPEGWNVSDDEDSDDDE